jgi:hypothetical protein
MPSARAKTMPAKRWIVNFWGSISVSPLFENRAVGKDTPKVALAGTMSLHILRDWFQLRVGGTFVQMTGCCNAPHINSGKLQVNKPTQDPENNTANSESGLDHLLRESTAELPSIFWRS